MRFSFRSVLGCTAALALVTLAGCDAMSNMFSPGKSGENAPARLAFETVLPRFQTSPFESLQLRVLAEYERSDETFGTIGTQTLDLSVELSTQQVPASIELGTCLSDDQRRGATTDPGACWVRLTLTLVGDGRSLDMATVPVTRLTPGSTTSLSQPVQLHEVAAVVLTDAATEAVLPASGVALNTGATFAAAARAVDATGAALPGRTPVWATDNAAVATVSATGVVTAVGMGSTSIRATIGGRTGSGLFIVTPPPRRLAIVAVPSTGTGRVISNPAGIDCVLTAGVASGTCAFDFAHGTPVQLTSTLNPNSASFAGWTGACVTNGMQPTCALVMDEARTAGAAYTALSSIRVQSSGSGVRIVSSPETMINCTLDGGAGNGTCTGIFAVGSTIQLTPVNFTTARVTDFTGCDTDTPTNCTLLVTAAPRTVTVEVAAGRLLSVTPQGQGSGVISAPGVDPEVSDPNISCGLPAILGTGVCASRYPIGSLVTVTATAQPGSQFSGWSGAGCDNNPSNICVITMTSPQVNVAASFALTTVQVTLQLSGSGGGRVFADGTEMCLLGDDQTFVECVVNLPRNVPIEFTGAPLTTGQFLTFGGACAAGKVCELSINTPVTITAQFTSQPPEASVSVVPRAGNIGRGFIMDSNEELGCDFNGQDATGTCSLMRTLGSNVTLYAYDFIDGDQFVFSRWGASSPCPNGVETQCSFALTGNTVIEVEFVQAATLALSVDGPSNGEVNVAAPGFRTLSPCSFNGLPNPTECEYYVPMGSSVELRAITTSDRTVSTSGATFCSWSGVPWDQSCSFVLNEFTSGFIYFFAPFMLLDADEAIASAETVEDSGTSLWVPELALCTEGSAPYGAPLSSVASSTFARSKSGFASMACL